jgi:hypothetical protein
MALETQIIEFPFTGGQNEGTERAVLPLGQLSYLQNARFRRNGRISKRNGYTSQAITDVSGAAIGGTDTYVTTLGEKFVAVDDRFYFWDENGGGWSVPPVEVTASTKKGTRLLGRWPQFMPAPTFAPINEHSEFDLYGLGGTAQRSVASMTYAQNIIWTTWTFWKSIGVAQWVIRIIGTDQTSGRRVFYQEIAPSGAGLVTDEQQPHLLSTGDGTLVLIYDHFTAGVKDGIRIRLLTDRTVGFGATEYTVACIESAVNYYVGSADHILITYGTGASSTNVGKWSVTTQSFTTLTTTGTGGDGAPTQLSIFGIEGGRTWIGALFAGSGFTKARYFNSALASVSLSGNLATPFAAATLPVPPVLFASRPATPDVVTLVMYSDAKGMAVFDLDGATGSGDPMLLCAARPISWPFNVGDETYIWVRHEAEAQLGVATLVRIPLSSEYASTVSPYAKSFPIEATLDDEDIDEPVAIAASGPTFGTPLSTPLGYLACLTPTVESFTGDPATTYYITKPLLVPVRHRSEGTLYTQPCIVPVCGKHFVASAQSMFVDDNGATEAGFIQSPASALYNTSFVAGNMTPNSTYFYTCVFESTDSSGRVERSAPCLPLEVNTTANGSYMVSFGALELSKKTVRANVYRTLSDRQTFHFLTTVDATPVINSRTTGENYFSVTDSASDTDVGSNEQLYIQLGQELANSQFPACQFATVGGARLWVGGGFKADVLQASKPFRPRLSVEFADDDAFRVTLPQACTGLAWMDSLVAFTAEGIYVITGDGPDVAGVGAFSDAVRLPFDIGCINYRSVIATDEGIFFQGAGGLYLLPRGFAEPIAMDQVMDTLASYPYITSAQAVRTTQSGTNLTERTIQWTCVDSVTSSSPEGRTLVYDTVRKLWSVDLFAAEPAPVLAATWDGARILATSQIDDATHPFRMQSAAHSDAGTVIERIVRTGDIRPWGTFAHGVINRVGLMLTVQSSCTVNAVLTTEHGNRTAPRVYTTPSDTAGYLEVQLGTDTGRDVNFVRVEISESSTSQGADLIGMVIETDTKPQGFRFLKAADRIT